jgi:fructokinase
MIVVAGEALIDLVISLDGSVAAKMGGGPFNVARTIGRLGGEVSFLGTISTDRFGSRLFDQLLADGVDPRATLRTDVPTTLAAAELDAGGSASYRFYLDGTSSRALDRVPVGASDPAAVHVGTLGLVLEPMATTLVHYLGSLGSDVLVMTDPNCRSRVISDRASYLDRLTPVYRHSHVVKISNDDAEYMAPELDPLDYARTVLAHGVAVVLLTAGGDHTWVVSADAETAVPTEPVTVADTIGAGDSFGGGFLTWWMSAGYGIAELHDHALVVAATEAAQEVAGITCQRVGADPPRRHELSSRWSA